MQKLLRVDEVAERLNITVPRAYELIRAGVIPCVALGRQRRVDPTALETFISKGGELLPPEVGWNRARPRSDKRA